MLSLGETFILPLGRLIFYGRVPVKQPRLDVRPQTSWRRKRDCYLLFSRLSGAAHKKAAKKTKKHCFPFSSFQLVREQRALPKPNSALEPECGPRSTLWPREALMMHRHPSLLSMYALLACSGKQALNTNGDGLSNATGLDTGVSTDTGEAANGGRRRMVAGKRRGLHRQRSRSQNV